MSYAMNKESRGLCWSSRDQFWNCIEQHGEEAESTTCRRYKDAFQENCPKQWIAHFKRIRKRSFYEQNIEKHGDPVKKLEDVPQ